jgi:methionyl-tRNA formyltransferase
MKIIFFGTPSFVIPVLESLVSSFEVIGVVTAPDSIQGRKKVLTPSPVKQFALEQNIPVLQPHELKTEEADLYVVAAYGKIIPQSILDIPKNGALNIHPSLLPKYRGPSPIQTALLHGNEKTGVSIIKMDAKMDHGPIVSQWETAISPNDTFESLHNSLFQDAADRLPAIISDFINGKITPIQQDEAGVSFCKMITRESGYFDSTNPPSPEELDKMIRAYYPWPTAWTKVRIKNNEERIMKLLPGKRVQMEGKNVMEMKDFLNGYPELTPLLEKLLGMQH